jgi:hypothetical protein
MNNLTLHTKAKTHLARKWICTISNKHLTYVKWMLAGGKRRQLTRIPLVSTWCSFEQEHHTKALSSNSEGVGRFITALTVRRSDYMPPTQSAGQNEGSLPYTNHICASIFNGTRSNEYQVGEKFHTRKVPSLPATYKSGLVYQCGFLRSLES